MNTNSIQLYLDDSHLLEFDAIIIRSGIKHAILDQTAFYPEGGGQPSDIGVFLSGNLKWNVLKVIKRGNEIFHYLDKDVPQGIKVHCIIDASNRIWNTRRHSAEHLLTGLIENIEELPKVYSDLEKLEFQPSKLTEEQLTIIFNKFNEIVEKDLPVKIFYEDRSNINPINDHRKQAFLKKIPSNLDKLRMVDIGGYALTFCMGTHVKSTKEIGKLASLTLQEAKKNRKIIHFKLNN
ncbi:alanyl-tRNA editing protein [Candidatus Bathyarchaeota archaeon]|nr:alanyl-tRNA editing protein [Candidatus Bathyarchaeota archaeon]